MTEDEVATVEALYGASLGPRERLLLTTRKDLLGPLEKQEAYILRMAIVAVPCPACGEPTSQWAAGGEDLLTTPVADEEYRCHRCGTPLVWHLTITGQQFFTVNFSRREEEQGEG
jgi:endogenous inhibitor of DNA gyrase (YacG/DUF329 family)